MLQLYILAKSISNFIEWINDEKYFSVEFGGGRNTAVMNEKGTVEYAMTSVECFSARYGSQTFTSRKLRN